MTSAVANPAGCSLNVNVTVAVSPAFSAVSEMATATVGRCDSIVTAVAAEAVEVRFVASVIVAEKLKTPSPPRR